MILIRFSIQISFYFCLHQDIYFSVYYFSQVWHKGWHPYQSCHEKGHLNVCGWVGFLARRFIRDNLTLEIPNKAFVLYTFISKNRHKQDSKEIFLFYIFFLSSFKILQLCFIQYSTFLDCAILKKCLYAMLSFTCKK